MPRDVRVRSIEQAGASDMRILTTVIGVSVAARITSALYFGNSVETLPGVADQVSYHNLALRVMDGHGFSFGTGWWPATPADEPTAHWSYLYVLFLCSVYQLLGSNPLAARVIQAVIVGVLQPLLTWRIGRRLFGRRVGLVSAVAVSVYSYFVYYSASLMTESLFIVALLWVMDISVCLVDSDNRTWDRSSLRRWALLGLAFTLAVLLRQAAIVLVPVVFGWYVLHTYSRLADEGRWRRIRKMLAGPMVAATVISVCIVPWSIRNYRAFGTFVLLNTNAGFAFYWGNHPIHGTCFVPILPGDGSGYGELIPDELLGLNEAEMDKALLRLGLAFALNDPGRYARLSLSRGVEFFKFWPSRESGSLSNVARVVSFGVTFPFLAVGLILLLRGIRRQHPGVILLILVSCVYSVIHLATWALIRYRLPVDALTMPIVAFSLVWCYERLFATGATSDSLLGGEAS